MFRGLSFSRGSQCGGAIPAESIAWGIRVSYIKAGLANPGKSSSRLSAFSLINPRLSPASRIDVSVFSRIDLVRPDSTIKSTSSRSPDRPSTPPIRLHITPSRPSYHLSFYSALLRCSSTSRHFHDITSGSYILAAGMVSAGDVRGLLGQVRWFNLAILTITPAVGVYGVYTTRLRLETLIWSVAYYVISMLGKYTYLPSSYMER